MIHYDYRVGRHLPGMPIKATTGRARGGDQPEPRARLPGPAMAVGWPPFWEVVSPGDGRRLATLSRLPTRRWGIGCAPFSRLPTPYVHGVATLSRLPTPEVAKCTRWHLHRR